MANTSALSTATGDPKYSNSIPTHNHGSLTGLSSSISTDGTYTFPNSTGSVWGLSSSSYNSYNSYDFASKTIDIEKLSKIDESKRKMIFDLILTFLNCTDYDSKTIMYNTLESYNVIVDQKSLERKIKISNITKDEKSKS